MCIYGKELVFESLRRKELERVDISDAVRAKIGLRCADVVGHRLTTDQTNHDAGHESSFWAAIALGCLSSCLESLPDQGDLSAIDLCRC